MKKLCKKIDNCFKIDMLKDKDMLNCQYITSVKSVCAKCDEFGVEAPQPLDDKKLRESLSEILRKHYVDDRTDGFSAFAQILALLQQWLIEEGYYQAVPFRKQSLVCDEEGVVCSACGRDVYHCGCDNG